MEPGGVMWDQRFVQNLRQRIAEDLTDRHRDLARGNSITTDAAATGMTYARAVGVIQGLEAALAHIQEIETDMSAKPKKTGD